MLLIVSFLVKASVFQGLNVCIKTSYLWSPRLTCLQVVQSLPNATYNPHQRANFLLITEAFVTLTFSSALQENQLEFWFMRKFQDSKITMLSCCNGQTIPEEQTSIKRESFFIICSKSLTSNLIWTFYVFVEVYGLGGWKGSRWVWV